MTINKIYLSAFWCVTILVSVASFSSIKTGSTTYTFIGTCIESEVGSDTMVNGQDTLITFIGLDGPISAEGLIAYFPLDLDTANSSVAIDLSGIQNHGNIIEAIPDIDSCSNLNSAYSFGSFKDIVIDHNEIYNSPHLSIAFWFKRNNEALTTLEKLINNQISSGASGRTYNFELKNNSNDSCQNALMYLQFNSGTNFDIDGAGDELIICGINNSEWYHVAGTLEQGLPPNNDFVNQKFYLNGVLLDSFTIDSLGISLYYSNEDIHIASHKTTSNFFQGMIDEFRMYNRILTNKEIEILASTKCTTPIFSDTICFESEYVIADTSFNTEGMHTFVVQNSIGCDSTVILDLHIRDEIIDTFSFSICANSAVTICGIDYSDFQPGTTIETEYTCLSYTSCDSIVHATISVLPEKFSFLDTIICSGESLLIFDSLHMFSFPIDTIIDLEYIISEVGPLSCDSTVISSIYILAEKQNFIDIELCPGSSLFICDSTYTFDETGSFFFQHRCIDIGPFSCDSLIDVNIFIPDRTVIGVQDTLCLDETITLCGQVFDCLNNQLPDTLICCDSIFINEITCPQCDLSIPTGITPNGDPYNEYFVIPAVWNNPDFFPNNELRIIDQWDREVFYASPYNELNAWNGNDKNGNPLPVGSYIYIYFPNKDVGTPVVGDVTIRR